MDTQYSEKMNSLRDHLQEKTGLAYFSSNEIITLCPRCERDRFKTSRKHGHLYISTDNPIFKCFRCSFKGIISKALKQFELNTKDYYESDIFNFDWIKNDTDKFFSNEDTPSKSIITPDHNTNCDNYINKLSYLNQRIPNFNISDHSDIILDINTFLMDNKIDIDKNDEFKKFLGKNFIGFLTKRNSLLICRNIDSQSNFRYFKINLRTIYFKDFFSRDLNNKFNNKVVLCEGVFDLLNIVEHEKTKSIIKDACIIGTALNNDYTNTLISILDYVKMTYADVIIFSDKDMDESQYMNLFFNNTVRSLTLYYNEFEKDFGTTNINPIKVPVTKYIKRTQNG